MSISKKIISVALTATTAVWASGALLLVPVVSAQTTADLQTQIAALLTQIQQLQAQLNAAKGVPSSSYSYTRDLTVGSKGADVTALQQTLINGGYLTAVSAPTAYFGSLTKAAVAAWQSAVGLSPAAGYFGPKSRAYVASLAGVPGAPSVPGVPAPASGLAVSLSSQNPAAGSLISSLTTAAARVPVLAVNLTAGNSGAVNVTELKFHKTGVISDSSISGAYLVESGKVLAQYNSISQGVIDFAGLGLSVGAGQTRTLWLAIDPSTGLSAGNTTGFSLASAADVISSDASGNAITASGVFPLSGSIFTVTTVTNPAIASLTITSSSIANSVTAGTTGDIVGSWNFTAANSKVWLKGVNFKVIGSANKSDLRNLKLYVNSAQIGSTLASVASDGTAYFDASANPGTINTGSNNIQIYADVMGSPSYNFQFEILNSYDVYGVDSQYNVPVSAAANAGTLVSIQQGQITVSQSSDTPTGNLAVGQSNITLAKFTFYAAGEAVKIKYVDFKLTFVNPNATTSISGQVKNVAITDDAGGQIGTTINTPVSGNNCTALGGTSSYATSSGSGVYSDCFGTATSPVNYIVPANTTRVLSLKVDIQSTAVFGTVVGSLTQETGNNLQGLTSSASGNSGSATGASLSLASSQLGVTQNTAIGTQNVSTNASNVKIGSYAFSASSADGVTVSNLTLLVSMPGLQNVKVMVGGAQFGSTWNTVGNGTSNSFSGTPFTVPKGGTTYVDVYADIISGAAGATPATTLTGISGTGVTSYNSVGLAANVPGQGLSIAGRPTIMVTVDSATPASGQLVMGSAGNALVAFRFTETSNVENVKITDLNVFDTVNATSGTPGTGTKSGFGNLSLYNGSTLIGTAGSANVSGNVTTTGSASGYGYYYQFHFATAVVVPQANSITLVLKGDVSSYSSSGATDNTTHTFKIATSTDSANNTAVLAVIALGNSSNLGATTTLSSPWGNPQTLLRTKLAVSAAPLGVTSGRAKTSIDDLATLSFAADSAGALQVNSVTLTFNGSAPSVGAGFYYTAAAATPTSCATCGVQLYDAANGTTYFPVASTTSGTNGTLQFNLGGYTISPGTSKSFNVRVNSAGFTQIGSQSVSQTLSITVAQSTNLGWTDALDTSAVGGLNIPAALVPVNVQSVSYSIGS